MFLETKKIEYALELFNKQSKYNEIAENQYYLALSYLKMNKPKESKICLEKSKELYLEGRKMIDPYSNPMDKIYLKDIELELKNINSTIFK